MATKFREVESLEHLDHIAYGSHGTGQATTPRTAQATGAWTVKRHSTAANRADNHLHPGARRWEPAYFVSLSGSEFEPADPYGTADRSE